MGTPIHSDTAATRATVEGYLESLKSRQDWQRFFSDDVIFTSCTSPNRQIAGRERFVEGTKRFYGTIEKVEVRQVIADGDRACALTRYALKSPVGSSFESDVAEVFHVHDGKIDAFDIYFDTAPYRK